MDPFGKYDVLREVELQATTCKIEFSANPTENLQVTPESELYLSDYISRKTRIVIVSRYF